VRKRKIFIAVPSVFSGERVRPRVLVSAPRRNNLF
jgi:hypothetical protein